MVLSLRTPTFRNFTFAELREDVVIIMKIGLKLRLRACPARGNLAWDKKYYLLVDLKIKHVLLVIVLLYTNAVIFESTTRRQSQ